MKFPDWWEAPDELFRIDGHCGLVAAWVVLRYFGKRVSVPNLVEACRYTKRHGVFAVSLAAALKTQGLSVSFHSERDAQIGGFERRCYAYARRLGIVAEAPLELSEVLRRRKHGNIPIVCSILLLVTAIFRICWGHATELYDCRWQMAARCPRVHSSPDGLILTS